MFSCRDISVRLPVTNVTKILYLTNNTVKYGSLIRTCRLSGFFFDASFLGKVDKT